MRAHALSQKQSEDGFKEEVLRKAFLRMGEELDLNRQELCAIIDISEASMSRLCDGKRQINPKSKSGEVAILMLRIYRSLDTLFGGNKQQYQQWYRSYNHHLNGTPAELVQTIEGLCKVTSYLDAIRGKL